MFLRFTPEEIQLDTKLKPFIPSYIPAIGEVDAFLKMNRPDNFQEELGLIVLDEPTILGIDPSIFSLELSYKLKSRSTSNFIVKSVENAEKNPMKIQNWIDQIANLHKEKMSSDVFYNKPMPNVESLMQIWPESIESILKDIPFPGENLNISLDNYSKLVCNMLDIPVHKDSNKSIIQALHVLFTLYSEFKANVNFQRKKEKGEDNVQSMKFY
jgi:intraflagellar transport protein 46